MKILLAEDDANISLLMKLTLEKMGGHQVTIAADGEKALQMVEAQSFDLILLDGMMPKKDGFQVCQELKQGGYSHIPVIFLSAKSQARDIALGLELGAIGYIEKPFDPILINEKILSLFKKQSAA